MQGTDSSIWYREDESETIRKLAEDDVKARYPNSTFKADTVVVVTFYNIANRYFSFRKNTFQIVMAYNIQQLFLVMNYDRLDDPGARTGFSVRLRCNFKAFSPITTSYKLKDHSNVGIQGRYVYNMNDEVDCTNAGKFLILFLYTLTSVRTSEDIK